MGLLLFELSYAYLNFSVLILNMENIDKYDSSQQVFREVFKKF